MFFTIYYGSLSWILNKYSTLDVEVFYGDINELNVVTVVNLTPQCSQTGALGSKQHRSH